MLVALLLLAFRIATLPRTIWELDEVLFTRGVMKFEPLAHHPHPPGYPLTVGLGKFVAMFGVDAFRALQIVSLLSDAIGVFFLTLALAELIAVYRSFSTRGQDDEVSAPVYRGLSERASGGEGATVAWIAALGALLFHATASMLVHGALALSDPPALMFLQIAICGLAYARRSPGAAMWMLAIGSAGAIGCRPQYAVAVLPFLLVALLALRIRRAAIALGIFTAACLLWFVPLVQATGGVRGFADYETKQASYVAAQDAEVSRTGYTAKEVALRFVSHPYGPKLLAIPALLLGLVGALRMARTLRIEALALLLLYGAQTLFCFLSADPADGARYVLPAVLAWCVFGACAIPLVLQRAAIAQGLVVIVLASGAMIYVKPILQQRLESDAPFSRAVRDLQNTKGAVVLYPTSLKPHAELLLANFTLRPIDPGLAEFVASPRRVVRIVDGRLRNRADVFASYEWSSSDALRKLTRDRYEAITLVEVPPEKRFATIAGIHPLEVDEQGREWRWLGPDASLQVPAGYAEATLQLSLPDDGLLEENVVDVRASGDARVVRVARGRTESVTLRLTGATQSIELRAARSLVPAEVSEINHDRRLLAVQLQDLALTR